VDSGVERGGEIKRMVGGVLEKCGGGQREVSKREGERLELPM